MNETETASPSTIAPSVHERLQGMDVARGVALLGIFFVNAKLFGQPFGEFMKTGFPKQEGWLSQVLYLFTEVFCSGKFYPLFSLLFGAGLAIMYQSARNKGVSFGWIYVRRLMLLAIFGILHILFLWSGDILLIYASIGVWMIWLGRLSSKTLVIIALSVLGFGLLIALGFTSLTALASMKSESEVVIKAMPEADDPIQRYWLVLRDWNTSEEWDSRLSVIETEVMSQGPWWAAMLVRLFTYLYCMVFVVLVMFWVILPCFCLGAALLKSGFFHGEKKEWRKRFLLLGCFVALPLDVAGVISLQYPQLLLTKVVSMLSTELAGPMLSLAYLSLILYWVESGALGWLRDRFANVGRMALTCYLLESFFMSAIMLHWGWGRFGNNTWVERAVWLLSIYALILIFANIWMSRFKLGPIEWIWRVFTYLRIPRVN